MLQHQIDTRIAQLDAALSEKLGRPATVRYSFERVRGEQAAWIYTYGDLKAEQIVTLARSPSVDEAFSLAVQAIAALRTAEDELADLGLLNEQQAEAA